MQWFEKCKCGQFANTFGHNCIYTNKDMMIKHLEQHNKELRQALKQCMTWLQKESKSMPNYDITQSVLWQNFEEILKQEERDE